LIALVDTNVFLDVIREEGEFLRSSEEFLRRVQSKEIMGLASCVVLMEIKWALYEKRSMQKRTRRFL